MVWFLYPVLILYTMVGLPTCTCQIVECGELSSGVWRWKRPTIVHFHATVGCDFWVSPVVKNIDSACWYVCTSIPNVTHLLKHKSFKDWASANIGPHKSFSPYSVLHICIAYCKWVVGFRWRGGQSISSEFPSWRQSPPWTHPSVKGPALLWNLCNVSITCIHQSYSSHIF